MNFEQLTKKVLKWADDKSLTKHANRFQQYAKVNEEVGELGRALLNDNRAEQEDAIGDSFVTLVILADQLNLDPTRCFEIAYEVIKNRTGKTIDGTFIKD